MFSILLLVLIAGKSWGREVTAQREMDYPSSVFVSQFFHEVHIQEGHMKYSFA